MLTKNEMRKKKQISSNRGLHVTCHIVPIKANEEQKKMTNKRKENKKNKKMAAEMHFECHNRIESKEKRNSTGELYWLTGRLFSVLRFSQTSK